MPLSEHDKERVRYHLGFIETMPSASIQFGIARPLQTLFLVEEAMNNILPLAVPRVQRLLKVMDDIEQKLVDAQDRLAAKKLDTIELRDSEPDQLEREYVRWGNRLADILGCPIYPHSRRYQFGASSGAGSIPVR